MSGSADIDALRAEIDRLQTALGIAQRSLRQTERVAATSEALATRSKRAMLRSQGELEQHVAELRAAKAQAEEAVRTKGRFLATMSHELRTPLHGMVGSAELLQTTDLDPEQQVLVDLLRRSANSLLAIVNDVLDFSRVEASRVELEQMPFRLSDCVDDVVRLQQQVANEKGIALTLQVDPRVPETVRGDAGRLRQVLMNLVSNALKFTARGEVAVVVEPSGIPDLLRFLVRDTGCGIRPEAQSKLFEAFVQEDASTTRRFGGTGLGLVISKRLVELMGGTITLESRPGLGTTFRFTCRLPASARIDVPAAAPTLPQIPTDGPRGHVLVVDDNAGNRMLVRKMLDRLGCTSAEACDGVGAVDAVRGGTFDLVLMDCGMPVMDGYEATRAIRALPARSTKPPVVALTAYSMPEDEARCRQAGMDDYLSKPLRMQDLAAILDQHLGSRV